MRKCPKCGYEDPRYWKHSKYSFHVDFCSFENFRLFMPQLAKKLDKGGKIVSDEFYYYRLTKTSQVVQRIAKTDVLEKPFGAEKYEKFKHNEEDRRFRKWLIGEHEEQRKLFNEPPT